MKHILKQFMQREANPFIQFIKYAISGGIATVVDVVVFYILAWKVIPALGQLDPIVQLLGLQVGAISETLRSVHYIVDKAITFLFSNFTAYIFNILWVFHPGRHSRLKELGLFYLVSIISFALGTFLGWVMIRWFGFSTTVAYLANMIASLMINFVCRKYIIFKG